MKQSSIVKIVWGYIWRFIGWNLVIMFILEFLAKIIMPFIVLKSGNSYGSYVQSLEKSISIQEISAVITLIMGLISTVLACKLTTSEIKKKFVIDSNNVNQIFKYIVIVLVVALLIYLIYSFINITEMQSMIDTYKKLSDSYTDFHGSTELLSSLEQTVGNFFMFCNIFSIISIVLNSLVYILIIFFEKKLLKV